MLNFVRILKIALSKRALLIPVGFFLAELVVAIILNWQLFGEKYEFSSDPGSAQVAVHNPLIVIRSIHSDRLTHPYASLTAEVPMFKFYSPGTVLKALAFLVSLVCAYIGLFISMLWINNYFKNRIMNVKWWLWPTACLGAHFILFLLANGNFSNILLKQF
jgi:hypothetical protein